MNKVDAIKDAIAEEKFNQEPLAKAIMIYLLKKHPDIYYEILSIYNGIIALDIDDKLAAARELEKADLANRI